MTITWRVKSKKISFKIPLKKKYRHRDTTITPRAGRLKSLILLFDFCQIKIEAILRFPSYKN